MNLISDFLQLFSWSRLSVAAVTSLLFRVAMPYGGASVTGLISLLYVVMCHREMIQPMTYLLQLIPLQG
jgi:hypothetical protein